jgi:hypothetical protein
MTSITLLFGYLGCMLLAAAVAAGCARRYRLSRAARITLVLGSASLLLVPANELMLVEYLRAAIGDLSIVTQVLLAAFLVGYVAQRRLGDERQMCAVMIAAVAGAAFLYPAALGLARFDPYALGYASLPLMAALAVLTVAAWYLRFEWLAACLLVAVAARVAGVLESRNLWDYLVDPLLALYAAFWLARMALQRLAASAAARSAP